MHARLADRLLAQLAAMLLLLMTIGCAVPAASSPRKDVMLSSGWQFVRQDVPQAQTVEFDDAKWEQVTLPHTWNALDGQDGGNNYYRGRGWYRLHLTIDSSELNTRELFLRFDGSSMVTQVYVN